MEEDNKIEWKIPEEAEGAEESEELEDSEGGEELENVIQETPTSFIRRTDAEQVAPFLEQEPIEAVENLEQDLQDAPGQTEEGEAEQPTIYNAPIYGDYEGRDYEGRDYETRTDETYPERFNPVINPPAREPIMPMRPLQTPLEELPKRLLTPTETTAWKSDEQLQSWKRDEDKKYKSAADLMPKRKRRDNL